MIKRVKHTAIWKEWKLINPHLLRPWSSCKVWHEISYADFFSSSVWHEHCDHPNTHFKNWIQRLCASGLVVMGFLMWEEGSGFSGFWEIAACVNSGVTLKGLRGVENVVVAVEESCVPGVKSGTPLIICSSHVLVFNCSLKARYLFWKWKYRSSFRFDKVRHPCCPVFLA